MIQKNDKNLSFVCIYAPFSGKIGIYFTSLARIAVPIFFL